MCNIQRKSKSIKSKGEKPPCLTQQPHHPPTALSSPAVVQGTEGLTLTPLGLLSISFEECTGFIKPTQTGAPPPPPPQTHTLCSSTINTPRQRAAEEKPPEPSTALAGEHREPLSWQGHGEARDKGSSVFGKRYRDRRGPHSFIQSPTAGGDSTAPGSPVESTMRTEMGILLVRAGGPSSWIFPFPPNCQDLAPVKPARSVLCTRAKLVMSMQPTPGDTGQKEN